MASPNTDPQESDPRVDRIRYLSPHAQGDDVGTDRADHLK